MATTVIKLIAAAAGALAGTAVAKELNKPTDERDWHGNVAASRSPRPDTPLL